MIRQYRYALAYAKFNSNVDRDGPLEPRNAYLDQTNIQRRVAPSR